MYIYNRRKIKSRKSAFKENRSMKVYKQYDNDYRTQPQIRLQGHWLKDLGFEPGSQINVHCENNKLTITLANDVTG